MVDHIDIGLHIPLTRKRGDKQKLELQQWITETLAEQLRDLQFNWTQMKRGEKSPTCAEAHAVQAIFLESEVGETEIHCP